MYLAALLLLLSVEFGPEQLFAPHIDEGYPRASSDGASTIVAWRGADGLAATVFGSLDEPRRAVELPGSPQRARRVG